MRALVTNDDGVRSAGLLALASAALAKGLDVTVVAPSYDASGSSAAMTATSHDGQVMVDAVEEDGGGRPGIPALGIPVLGVPGPPAFIVRAAMYGAFGPVPDMVLSGVNRGLNTGRAVLHSGTVGAALTAATYGRSGLAVSVAVDDDDTWWPESPVLGAALDWLADAPGATVLNVNVPAPGRRAIQGVRSTILAEAGTVQGNVTESGGDFVPVTFADDTGPAEAGTDAAALADGYVSVTAIRAVTEDDRLDIESLIRRAAIIG